MQDLEVIVLDERHIVGTPDELAAALAARVDGGNHFQIAALDAPYPMLDVMVHDPYAVVHFWLAAGMAGDQAASNVVDPPMEIEFPHSQAGDTITMPGSVLVDVATAVACVEEFARTRQRPTAVEWVEL